MKIEDVIDVISMNTVEPCDAITLARSITNDNEYLDLYLRSGTRCQVSWHVAHSGS